MVDVLESREKVQACDGDNPDRIYKVVGHEPFDKPRSTVETLVLPFGTHSCSETKNCPLNCYNEHAQPRSCQHPSSTTCKVVDEDIQPCSKGRALVQLAGQAPCRKRAHAQQLQLKISIFATQQLSKMRVLIYDVHCSAIRHNLGGTTLKFPPLQDSSDPTYGMNQAEAKRLPSPGIGLESAFTCNECGYHSHRRHSLR